MTCLRNALVLLFVVGVSPVLAQEAAQTGGNAGAPRRDVSGQLGVSINNAGLQNNLNVAWTVPLSTSVNPVLSGAHLAAGVGHTITPAQTGVGGWVEYAPLSIASVRAGASTSAYFGTFDSLMSFDHYTDPFGKDDRDAHGRASAGAAIQAYMAPAVQVKAGPLVAMSGASFEWWRANAEGPYFYEPTRDTLLKSDGDSLVNTSTVVMLQRGSSSRGALSIGAIHTLTRVFDAPGNQIQKLGVIAAKEWASTHFHLSHPRLTVLAARYLDDPSKEGQWTAGLAIGFRR